MSQATRVDGRSARSSWSKERLRTDFQAQLATLDEQTAAAGAARIAKRVLYLPEIARAERILTCLSFGTEVDTWQLTERLLAQGKQLFVPRADPRKSRLHVHPYPCPLRTLSFGLRQPPRGTPELDEAEVDRTLDAVLVLGLAFDRRGTRLGYGGGYFDRFLAHRPFPAVGLTHSLQLVDALPREPHDVPMSVIVTESESWRVNEASA